MYPRTLISELRHGAAEYPVLTLFGPRQSGKSTLTTLAFPDLPALSLEDPDVRLAATGDPRGFLAPLVRGAILDEVQRAPELLSYIQGIVDREPKKRLFVLTGSHQPLLQEAIGQSLAGRTAIFNLFPLSLAELKPTTKSTLDSFGLVVQGFYPRLHHEKLDPRRFFNGYLQTYVERDVRSLLQVRDLSLFQKFLQLLAGRIGQILNLASLANDVGISTTALKQWLSVLQASFLIFELPPWHENRGKRLIKSAKIYFTDVGLAAHLLGIHTPEQAIRDPLRGNLYENLVVADILKSAFHQGVRPEFYFYRDSHGVEVDLILREAGKILPIEIKSSATFTPDFLKGIKKFRALGFKNCGPGVVFYNGDQTFPFDGVTMANPLRLGDSWRELVGNEKFFGKSLLESGI